MFEPIKPSLDTYDLHPLRALEELSRMRQRPALLLCGSSLFSSDTATQLYAFLRKIGPQEALDVVFQSPGGDPVLARRLAVLLREFTQHLSILVMHEARSAATLFCLAADELIMTPLSILSPIDPQLPGQQPESSERSASSSQEPNMAASRRIATEEVRLFREMASAWFGVGGTDEERFSLLHAFNQRIFPSTLTAFYRADQEMRYAADELQRYHQPDATIRQRIRDQLINGFFSHAHTIHREEALALGLPIRQATEEEEACLWRLLNWSRAYQSYVYADPEMPSLQLHVRGVLVGKGFAACDVIPLLSSLRAVASASGSGASGAAQPTANPRMREWGWRQVSLDALTLHPERGDFLP